MLTDLDTISFVPSADLARARAFYEGVLGLTVTHQNDWALVVGSAARQVRVVMAGEFTPQSFTILGWETPDMAGSIAALVKRGVEFLRYEGFDQNDVGIWTTPGGDQVAWFHDPDGNVLSLSSRSGG